MFFWYYFFNGAMFWWNYFLGDAFREENYIKYDLGDAVGA